MAIIITSSSSSNISKGGDTFSGWSGSALVCGWCCCCPRWSTLIFFFLFLFLSFSSTSSSFTFPVASQPIPTISTTNTSPSPSPYSSTPAPSPSPSPSYNTPSASPSTTTTTIYLAKAGSRRQTKHTNGNHNTRTILIITLSVLSPIILTSLFIMAFLKYIKNKIRRRSKRVEDVHDHQPGSPNSTTSTSSTQQFPDRPGSTSSADYIGSKKITACPSSWVPKRFSWEEIERLTMNFTSLVVGEGGFSNVYLSHFSDSSLGALKFPSTTNSERLNRLFKQELEVLLHVRHDNIVNLLGYCDERDECALVFEYVPNGSLHDKLHNNGNGKVLSWKSRMSIAYQLAQAIGYLHDECKPQIVHGDIKSSNILLDDELNCKLCDFGFSKMGFSSTVMRSSMSPSLMGSPGYMDPLYLKTGIASKKNDVYSFGVIILEMITGFEAFCPEKEQLLTSIAGPIIRDADKVAEMVDPRMVLAGGGKGGVNFDMDEAKVMANIAGLCLKHQPSMRPSMAEICKTMTDKISF